MGCSRTRKDRLDNSANKTGTTQAPTLPSNESTKTEPSWATDKTCFTLRNRKPKKSPGSTLDTEDSFRDDQSRGERRALQDKLFGRKSEKSTRGDRSNDLVDPEEVPPSVKKRGAQPGHAGHGRRDYSHLPVQEEFAPLPEESLACPHCGKLAVMMSATEDSELTEIDVRAHRRRIRRRRYRATCDCDPTRQTLTAPPPPKLIPKGNYGISIWVHVLLDKYSSYRPTERLLGQLEQYDLDLPAGTVNDGLKRIEPMMQPIYEALCIRNRLGDFHQADETRWRVFVLFDGKKGYGWWLWMVLGKDTVIYLLDRSRGHEVPEVAFWPGGFGDIGSRSVLGLQSHGAGEIGADRAGVLLVHVRRDFVGVGKGWPELKHWCFPGCAAFAISTKSTRNVSGTSRTQPNFKNNRRCCVGRWRRCTPKRRKTFPIQNFANHAVRFWKASKRTGRG